LQVFAWKEKLSLGCDAGMQMMEDEFEGCRRTSEPLRKIPFSPNHLFEIHF
jgi:hypothetical protein